VLLHTHFVQMLAAARKYHNDGKGKGTGGKGNKGGKSR
jgi:hypothetical protein